MRRLQVRTVLVALAAAFGLAAGGCGSDKEADTLSSDRALKGRVDKSAMRGKKA